MAIKNTINLQVYSDTEMNDFKIEDITQKNESGGTVSTMLLTLGQNSDVGLTGTITASKNNELSNHTLKFRATAKFSGETITTPYLTIVQDKHPNKYSSGDIEIVSSDGSVSGKTTINFSESGGRFTIKAKAIQDETGDVLSNISYFSFGFVLTKFIDEISVFEANGYAQAQYKVSPNASLSKRTGVIKITFNDKNGSSWVQYVIIKQDEHVKRITDVVFNYSPLNIGHAGGNILINCSYKEDGEVMELSGVSVVLSSSTFDANDYYLPDSGATRTMVINENFTETYTGAPNKSMRLQAIHPVTNTNIVGDLIQQATRKSSEYIFSFSDGTTNKITEDIIPSSGDYFQCHVISKKGFKLVNFTPSSDVNWIEVGEAVNGSFMVNIHENKDEKARNGTIKVVQDDSPMPPLTYQISQKGENKYQIPNFDYMIIKVGFDILSGKDLDLFLYAPDMPEKYQQFKLAGSGATKILKEELLPDKLYDFTDIGDEKNNVLRWCGDNNGFGGESYVVSPKTFLTSDFIKAEIGKNKTYFDIHLYGYFHTEYSNLATITMEAYQSDGTSDSNPQLLNKKNNLFFYPGKNARQISRIWKNAYVRNPGQEEEDWLSNYTKIATFRYTYTTGVWQFQQNTDVVVSPTEEDKETVVEGMPQFDNTIIEAGNQDLINDYLFGYVLENDTNEWVQFFALGKDKLARFNFNDREYHNTVRAHLHYDQTKYSITKVAIGDCDSSITTIEWAKDGSYLLNKPWSVSGNKEVDDKLYLYFEAIDKNESDDYGEVEKDTRHFQELTSSDAIPLTELKGEFTDTERGIIVPFTIESASTSTSTNRKIKWKRHVPETSSCTFKMTKLEYDTSLSALSGIQAYASTPLILSLWPGMDELIYNPNAQNCNLAFMWKNPNPAYTVYKITLIVSAWGNDNTKTRVEYAQSNTSSRPNKYIQYEEEPFDGPNGFRAESAYTITLNVKTIEGEYIHLKVTCFDKNNNKGLLFKYTNKTMSKFKLEFGIHVNTSQMYSLQ